MPLRIHSLIRIIALCAEMGIHAGIFALMSAGMLVQRAGAYEILQFLMNIGVMFIILVFMFFKFKYKDIEPSRVPNVTCFSIILSLSLTGAVGLVIRATSGDGFCEEFLSSHPEKCREAGSVVAMSWTSVVIAVAGILISWSDKYPGAAEEAKLCVPQRPFREIELLRQQSTSKPTNVPPRIHIPRPPATYAASRPRGTYYTQGPIQPTLAQTLPRHPQRFAPNRVPSSLPGRSNGASSLVLHREVHGPAGRRPMNQSIFAQAYDLRTPPENVHPMQRKNQGVEGRDTWKQKYLV